MAKKVNNVSEEETKQLVNNSINVNEIKAELVEYMKREIDIEIDDVVREKERKYIRAKSRKIFWLEIIILLLVLVIIGGLVYLYKDHYFDKYFINNNEVIVDKDTKDDKTDKEESKDKEETDTKDEKEEEKIVKPTLEELIKKYDGILNNINLSNENEYLKEFYDNNYTNELKLSMATALIGDDNLKEEGSFIIKREVIEKNYNKLFSSKIELEPFKYNGIEFNYIKSLDTFIGNGSLVEGVIIDKKITKIEEASDVVIVTTREYYTVDDEEYSPLTTKDKYIEKIYEFELKDNKYLLSE